MHLMKVCCIAVTARNKTAIEMREDMKDMKEIKLAEVELQFAELIWEAEPIPSGELVKLCEKELNWKKSTTYTVLRKLCQRKVLQNEDSIVTSLIKKDEYFAIQSEQFVEDTFQGSLPGFLSAFMSRRKLSDKQVSEIEEMIEAYRRGEKKR